MRVLLLVALLACSVSADMYMHNPPGSNDRNRERSDNRNNGDRLFDSQNNGQGGYPWRGDRTASSADPITYYVGSKLRIEWTNQHACGANPNVLCQVIIQYACSPKDYQIPADQNAFRTQMFSMRDGYPQSGNFATDDAGTNAQGQALTYRRRQFANTNNADGTNRIPLPGENGGPTAGDEAAIDQFYYLGVTSTNPADPKIGLEYGMHESYDFYRMCQTTRRNKGLYHADQILNGDQATKTRQNPNGNRRGLECPEERDYYPWWNPSPWRDAAILVSNTDLYQDYFKEQSQNVKERFFCNCNDACRTSKGGTIPIDQAACEALPNAGVWTRVAPFGIDAPDVVKHDFTRDNHLGNALHTDANGNLDTANPEPEMASYIMTIPKDCEDQMMVVRVRYNMSATHYNITYADKNANGVGADSGDDCPRISNAGNGGVDDQTSQFTPNTGCDTRLTVNSVPLYNRPYVQVFDSTQPKLSLAINTNQVGRTFQDRSYVAWVGKRPSQVGGRTIYNLNVRGRRGNIVQCYPAVEYDFVPSRLQISDADFVHIQIHGSDYNAAKNANNGEGWQFSDRSNIVQTNKRGTLFPLLWGSDENKPAVENAPMFKSRKVALMWALLGQDPSGCQAFTDGQTNEQNSLTNCGKLNSAPARFPLNAADGLVQLNSGEFTYMSTRNNNFSNRSQKANVDVSATASNVGLIVGVTFGVIAGLCLIGGGTLYYGKKHPNTRAGAAYKRVSSMFTRNKGAAAAPNMEYQRS